MSEVDISIVIVSYNTRQITQECLLSLYQNDLKLNFEVFVVDNNSTDGSVEMICNDFPQVHLIKNEDNRGFAAANNQAFKKCSGDKVLLLNSDTLVIGDVIFQSVKYLDNHPKVGAMGCRVLNTDHSTQLTCSEFPTNFNLFIMTLGLDRTNLPYFRSRYLMRHWNRDAEREVDVISGCYLLIRKKVMDEVGVLDEDFFFFGEETEWCYRIRKNGWSLKFAPVGEIVHHGGASVKKLNYKRDVLLTSATVRLHRKCYGLISAFVCFMILLLFNVSRAFLWVLASVFTSSKKDRANHFVKVVKGMPGVWKECLYR